MYIRPSDPSRFFSPWPVSRSLQAPRWQCIPLRWSRSLLSDLTIHEKAASRHCEAELQIPRSTSRLRSMSWNTYLAMQKKILAMHCIIPPRARPTWLVTKPSTATCMKSWNRAQEVEPLANSLFTKRPRQCLHSSLARPCCREASDQEILNASRRSRISHWQS